MTWYLSAHDVQEMNAHFVGPHGLRDFGLLDSAVLRPQASAFGGDAFPTLAEKAAALPHGLARNHPFVDGNKRTAWSATEVLCRLNGYQLCPADQGEVVALVVDTAEGQLDVATIASTLKTWATPLDLPPLP
ncbi:type II toxin-antitoxin system death-on-curing family toxin [Actinopolyspora mortivallis]|uniref:type II toxin-antitoxin system death-on-curing family toxin n=1 Tax=Actinopolyspora mortivallis TaxID=33906 RepID=UPI00037D664E|nr:type II toxin-antitoxin system death-on-curing family toxin [Actinopolyspora mortivallis]